MTSLGSNLGTANPDGSHQTTLVRLNGNIYGLQSVSWSSTGTIAYSVININTDVHQLLTIPAGGGKPTLIAQKTSRNVYYFADLCWSPDGSTIYFDAQNASSYQARGRSSRSPTLPARRSP